MPTPWNDKKKKTIEDLMTYKEKVFFICLGYTKNPSDADDLTQDVYLKALKKLDSLKDLERNGDMIPISYLFWAYFFFTADTRPRG